MSYNSNDMKIQDCKDFTDILSAVVNYGADIKAAARKVWSANKYRDREDIKYARKAYPEHETIIDRLTIQ